MNEKIQAILLKLVLELKKDRWQVSPDWEITLKGEGHAALSKPISVLGNMGDDEWKDNIDTNIDLRLTSEDELTYFPQFTIYANIFIDGGGSKDIAYKIDVDSPFTDRDVRNDKLILVTSKKISRLVEDYIENQYSEYVDQNTQGIQDYKHGGWKADDDINR